MKLVDNKLKLTISVSNPLNKSHSEADLRGGSYITGFLSSEFVRTFKNSRHSDESSSVVKKGDQLFDDNSNLKMFSRILKEFSKSLQISCAENSTNM